MAKDKSAKTNSLNGLWSYAFRHSLRILRLFFSILLIYKLNCTLVNWWWWIIAVTCNCLSYPDSFSALTGLRNIVMIVLVQLVHKQNSEDERQVVRKGLLTTQVASCIFPNFGRMNGLKTNRFKPNCKMRRWKRSSYLVCRHKNIWIASGRSSSLLLTWDESSEGAVEVEGRSPRSFFAIIMLCILGSFSKRSLEGFQSNLLPWKKMERVNRVFEFGPLFSPPEEWRNSLAWQSDVPFICPCCMWRDRHAIWGRLCDPEIQLQS